VVLGGRLPQAVRDWALQNIASTISIAYGSTETGNIAFGDAALVDRHPGAVGFIRPGLEVEVVDNVDRPVKLGHPGRLRVRTPLLASPSSTEGWFEPGDNAILFEDGLLAILERASDVLNVGGVKSSAVDLEAKLAAFEAIEDAAVTMISSVNGDSLAVVIVRATAVTPAQLMPMVKSVVPRGIPFSLIITRSIPRNDMGKIDRPALRQCAQRAERARTQHERRHA
jgi:3-phosphoshikimate 1-carboxyvinyltransferase/cyclohexanecarboxylate-CoA ligase